MKIGAAKILIVGGGIGGMAAAISLLQRGANVEIVEIDPAWSVYGAGITITGPTLRAFRDLGLLEAIGQHGFFSVGAHVHLFDGTLLSADDHAPIEAGLPSAGGIMRPVLQEIMATEVRRLGAIVTLGVSVSRFDQLADSVEVEFSDSRQRRYDLIVGADGIYSKTRQMIFDSPLSPVYAGQMSWRIVTQRPADMRAGQFYFGHRNVAGTIPCSQTQAYTFVLEPQPNPRRIPEGEKHLYVQELLKDFGGDLVRVREGITEHSSIVQRPFEYALQPLPWHVGRVVLLGDAVHATTAHLASGAGIAVEDGLVLAQELERAGDDIGAALLAYEQRRFERCRMVVESSVGICQAQLAHAPAEEIGARMGQAMRALANPV